MRLLVLGGTSFVGRHIVASAAAAGHDVTLFNRGVTNPRLFPAVTSLSGDRSTGDLAAMARSEWDAVIDISAVQPSWVRDSARLLTGRVGTYAFISNLNVYADLGRPGLTEDAPLAEGAGPALEGITAATYGSLKVAAEAEVCSAFPSDHLIVRTGTMAGPHDNTDKFTYWVRRMAAGRPVLGPPRPEQPVQVLHARDHADFVVGLLGGYTSGVFNVAGTPTTFARMLQACAIAADREADVAWAPEEFLQERRIVLPMEIRPEERRDGLFQVDCRRAEAAGLVNRPLVATALTVRRWDLARPDRRLRVGRGIDERREAALVAELRGRHRDGADHRPSAAVRRTPVSPLGLDVRRDTPSVPGAPGRTGPGRASTPPSVCCLIATTPRTGSWLLADLLDATGLAGQPQEFFRADFVRTFSRRMGLATREITEEYLGAVLASASERTGVFSAKLQPYDLTRLRDALRTFPDATIGDPDLDDPNMIDSAVLARWLPNPRYVHLVRTDRRRQAISWYRALMTNLWWEFRQDDDHPPARTWPDLLQVSWLEEQLEADDDNWRSYFRRSGIEALPVTYEELVAEPTRTVKRVLEFAGVDVPDGFEAKPTRLKRMADSQTDEWIAAYDAIHGSLPPKPRGWSWSLEDRAFVPGPEVQAKTDDPR